MFNTDARRVCIIDIPPRSGRSTLHGGTGRAVGFPVTLGGFKVDGEGEDGLFRHSHQVGALLFRLLAAGVQLPAVGVIGNGGDHFNELVDQFGSKTGTVHMNVRYGKSPLP